MESESSDSPPPSDSRKRAPARRPAEPRPRATGSAQSSGWGRAQSAVTCSPNSAAAVDSLPATLHPSLLSPIVDAGFIPQHNEDNSPDHHMFHMTINGTSPRAFLQI